MADFEAGGELARATGDSQLIGPNLAFGAWLASETGHSDDSQRLLEALLSLPDDTISAAADYLDEVGWLGADDPRVLARLSGEGGPLQRANRAIAEGRVTEAIEILEATGWVTPAAYARLRMARRLAAAGDDPEPWLGEAEAFYRCVGATRYLREIDGLRATRRSA